jgi:cysteine desulfuration protein SufE
MADFEAYPLALREVLEAFRDNPNDRNAMLVDYSDLFTGVPERIAKRPYPEVARVPHCESESFVFVENLDPGTRDPRLHYHFAVENPFGVSARALSAVLDQTVNGLRASEIAAMPIDDLVPTLFTRNISMGKGQGLLGIASMVKAFARRHLA